MLYQGQQQDPENNLYYLRARYYDPATGRFISRDPVKNVITDPQNLNGYSFTRNNPIIYSDPSGLWYVNAGLTAGVGLGITGGALINDEGISFYFGAGATTPGIGGSLTYSPDDPQTGGNVSLSAAAIGAVNVNYPLVDEFVPLSEGKLVLHSHGFPQ